jgi:hypothetical protein
MLIQLHQEFNPHQELLHQLDHLELSEEEDLIQDSLQDPVQFSHLDLLVSVMEDQSEEQALLEDLPLMVMEEDSLELELEDFQESEM